MKELILGVVTHNGQNFEAAVRLRNTSGAEVDFTPEMEQKTELYWRIVQQMLDEAQITEQPRTITYEAIETETVHTDHTIAKTSHQMDRLTHFIQNPEAPFYVELQQSDKDPEDAEDDEWIVEVNPHMRGADIPRVSLKLYDVDDQSVEITPAMRRNVRGCQTILRRIWGEWDGQHLPDLAPLIHAIEFPALKTAVTVEDFKGISQVKILEDVIKKYEADTPMDDLEHAYFTRVVPQDELAKQADGKGWALHLLRKDYFKLERSCQSP